MTYGPITLHFTRDEFLTFADSIGRLGVQIRQAAKDAMQARRAECKRLPLAKEHG